MSSRIPLLFRRTVRAASLVVLLLIVAVCPLGLGQAPRLDGRLSPPRAERVIVISLDGLDARYLNKRDEYGLRIPTLRHLMANGATARGVTSVYPSVTYPAHTTIVTGTLPVKHGIFGNEIFEPPDAPQTGAWNWFARDIKVDTLWDAAARKNLATAMISWPVSAGAGDYNLPEIYQSGESRDRTWQRISENTRPKGLVGEVAKRDPDLFSKVNKDESDDLRTRFAEYIIAEKRPHLTLVHLFDLDHFQHDYGPFTPEAFAILEKVDGYVGRILAAAERAGTLQETAVFIVSDHGFLPITKQIHPGVLLAEAGLVKTREEKDAQGNVRTVVTDWRAAVYPTSGSCSIILRDPNDKETLKKVRSIFGPGIAQAVVDSDSKVRTEVDVGRFKIVEAKEIRRLGANPRAVLMLDAAEGFTFGGNYTGKAITATKRRGQHGFLPTLPDYKASLIIAGAGITWRANLGDVRMIDIGPTIARVLSLKLRDAEGHALKSKDER